MARIDGNGMKWLYKAQNNFTNYYIVEDRERDLAIIIDWDLNEEEEQELIRAFKAGELEDDRVGQEWKPTEEVYNELWGREELA